MKLYAGLGLLLAGVSLGDTSPSNSTQILVNAGAVPILEIGEAHVRGQSVNPAYVNVGGVAVLSGASNDQPQCGNDKKCVDDSCCNSDGKCGFTDYHCKGTGSVTCLSNCDAEAKCGKNSPGGNKTCG